MTAAAFSTPPALSYRTAHARLLKAVAIAWGATAAFLLCLLLIAGKTDLLQAGLAAALVSNAAALASVPLLAWGLSGGPQRTAAAYMLSAFVRAAISVGGGVFAVMLGDLPHAATLLMIVPFYFAVLAAECVVLGRGLWFAAEPGATSPGRGD